MNEMQQERDLGIHQEGDSPQEGEEGVGVQMLAEAELAVVKDDVPLSDQRPEETPRCGVSGSDECFGPMILTF